jgi:hypothetical protein
MKRVRIQGRGGGGRRVAETKNRLGKKVVRAGTWER